MKKEASAILATADLTHWLLATPNGFGLHTDHHNLIFLFDPLVVVPDLSQISLRKVIRWAVRLSAYNYTCIHICRADNVWADLLGRWTVSDTVRRLVSVPFLPVSSPFEFEWPCLQEIEVQQYKFIQDRPSDWELGDGLWKDLPVWSGFPIVRMTRNCVFVLSPIPDQAATVKQHLLNLPSGRMFSGRPLRTMSGPSYVPASIVCRQLEGRGSRVRLVRSYTAQRPTTCYSSTTWRLHPVEPVTNMCSCCATTIRIIIGSLPLRTLRLKMRHGKL